MKNEKAVIAIIEKEGKVLALHRSPTRHSMPNKWQFVAGKIEEGENAESAAKREAMEETECIIETVKEGRPYEVYESTLDTMWTLIPVLCRYVSGEVVIDREHTDFKWINPEEAKNLDFVNKALDNLRQFGLLH